MATKGLSWDYLNEFPYSADSFSNKEFLENRLIPAMKERGYQGARYYRDRYAGRPEDMPENMEWVEKLDQLVALHNKEFWKKRPNVKKLLEIYRQIKRMVEESYECSPEEKQKILVFNELLEQYQTGKITREQFLERAAKLGF